MAGELSASIDRHRARFGVELTSATWVVSACYEAELWGALNAQPPGRVLGVDPVWRTRESARSFGGVGLLKSGGLAVGASIFRLLCRLLVLRQGSI